MNIRAQAILDSLSVALAELEKANRQNEISSEFNAVSAQQIRHLTALDDCAWHVVDGIRQIRQIRHKEGK